jgi:hypothetical protein
MSGFQIGCDERKIFMKEISKLNPWAEFGTKVAVPLVKINSGWLDGEQPPFEYENHRRFTVDTLTNELVDRVNRLDLPARGAVVNIPTMEVGNMGLPRAGGNVVEGALDSIEATAAVMIDDVPHLLIFEIENGVGGSGQVSKINLESGFREVLYSFTPGATADYRGLNMVCDGERVFLLERYGISPGYTFHLKCFYVQGGDVPLDWVEPYIGTNSPASPLRTDQILKVLPSGELFAAGNWEGLGSKCYIINHVTGAVEASGNPGLSGTLQPLGEAIAFDDGTIMFTTVDTSAGTRTIVGTLEADLSLVSGFPITPLSSATYKEALRIFRIDSDWWGYALNRDDNATPPRMYILVKDLAAQSNDYVASNLTYDFGDETKIGKIWFDGKSNIYTVVYLHTWAGVTPGGLALVRFNLASLSIWLGSGRGGNLSSNITPDGVFFFQPDVSLTPTTIKSNLTFDGRNIWVGHVDGQVGNFVYRVII